MITRLDIYRTFENRLKKAFPQIEVYSGIIHKDQIKPGFYLSIIRNKPSSLIKINQYRNLFEIGIGFINLQEANHESEIFYIWDKVFTDLFYRTIEVHVSNEKRILTIKNQHELLINRDLFFVCELDFYDSPLKQKEESTASKMGALELNITK